MATSQESRSSKARAQRSAHELVPFAIRVAGAWSWRLIAIGIVLIALSTTFGALTTLVVPLIIAVIIAAPLGRFVTWMKTKGIPRGLGAIISILVLIGTFSGLTAVAAIAIANDLEDLQEQVMGGVDEILAWISDGPLDIEQQDLQEGLDNAVEFAQENAWGLAGGTVTAVGVAGAFIASIIIGIIALFFFLRDGRKMWLWCINLLPGRSTAERVDLAAVKGWDTLFRYTRTSVIVAAVDALGIGMIAWILGVPLALPIAILTFVLAFIPIVGATVAGAVAVLIALVDGGWVLALLMLGGVLLVQQLESDVLYPWLFGRASALHPFAILVTISTGTLTLGIVGAVIAVPILAFAFSFVKSLNPPNGDRYDPDDSDGSGEPDTPDDSDSSDEDPAGRYDDASDKIAPAALTTSTRKKRSSAKSKKEQREDDD